MMVGLKTSSLQGERWRDYAIRFIFGGIVTAGTGLIAKRWGRESPDFFLRSRRYFRRARR
jgi:hypothetical protein